MRRNSEQFRRLVALSPFPSLVDCITDTSGYDFRKGQHLAVEQFVSQTGVEALDKAVLPWASRRDLSSFGADCGDPRLQGLGNKHCVRRASSAHGTLRAFKPFPSKASTLVVRQRCAVGTADPAIGSITERTVLGGLHHHHVRIWLPTGGGNLLTAESQLYKKRKIYKLFSICIKEPRPDSARPRHSCGNGLASGSQGDPGWRY
jgi:hypothetical protein